LHGYEYLDFCLLFAGTETEAWPPPSDPRSAYQACPENHEIPANAQSEHFRLYSSFIV